LVHILKEKAKAKLTIDDEKFVLNIINGEGDQEKTLFKDDTAIRFLEGIAEFLEFPDFEAMMCLIKEGDESSEEFDIDFDTEIFIPVSEIEQRLQRFIESMGDDMSYEIKNELRRNYTKDLAASVVESTAEIVTYRVFKKMHEVVLYKLVLDSDSLHVFPRLIHVISKYAHEVDIEVEVV